MSNQEEYLKEIANELKLIRKLLEKQNSSKSIKVGLDINPRELTTIVNEVNANKDALFTL